MRSTDYRCITLHRSFQKLAIGVMTIGAAGEYQSPIGRNVRGRDSPSMKKRIISAALWFYAGWTFGALIATALDLSAGLGPLIGAAATALFVADPRRIIWARRSEASVARD